MQNVPPLWGSLGFPITFPVAYAMGYRSIAAPRLVDASD
jgi:hypothetical protein